MGKLRTVLCGSVEDNCSIYSLWAGMLVKLPLLRLLDSFARLGTGVGSQALV